MKPEQFIREFGEKKAREVVEGAPVQPFGYDFIDHDYFDGADIQDGYSIEQCDGCVFVPDLKRLVESLDRVTNRGGLSKTKDHLDYLISFGSEFAGVSKDEIKELQQDVAVHESIYGGGDEIN